MICDSSRSQGDGTAFAIFLAFEQYSGDSHSEGYEIKRLFLRPLKHQKKKMTDPRQLIISSEQISSDTGSLSSGAERPKHNENQTQNRILRDTEL